jgi:hypothetical protein
MKKIYRVYLLGEIPPGLKERIAKIHASAIMAQGNDNTPGYTKDLNKKNGNRK